MAKNRWAQHYRVDELVREITVLRYEMIEIFREFSPGARSAQSGER